MEKNRLRININNKIELNALYSYYLSNNYIQKQNSKSIN